MGHPREEGCLLSNQFTDGFIEEAMVDKALQRQLVGKYQRLSEGSFTNFRYRFLRKTNKEWVKALLEEHNVPLPRSFS